MGDLMDIEAAAALVKEGRRLAIGGAEALLRRLPEGSWIGGTIPYFMTRDGGCSTRGKVFVDELPDLEDVRLATYGADELDRLGSEAFEHGFTLIAVPAFSRVFKAFAMQAPTLTRPADSPLVGWVPGTHFDEAGFVSPKAFAGSGEAGSSDRLVALHARLPEGLRAVVETINLFQPGIGSTLRFPRDGFAQSEVEVDGESREFRAWLEARGVDRRLPLLTTVDGERINSSFQELPPPGEPVRLHAPVFTGRDYRIAGRIGDYLEEFEAFEMPGDRRIIFCCNCVFNYLYAELEGVKVPLTGVITFGEIAGVLHNQTLAYLALTSA